MHVVVKKICHSKDESFETINGTNWNYILHKQICIFKHRDETQRCIWDSSNP